MKILYCRIGWMNSYNGILSGDRIKNGGSYNKEHIGHEIYNFSSYGGKYYGYVQPVGNTINIDKITNQKENDYIDGVLVVWVATKDNYGQVIVGWYKNARVYRDHQKVPTNILEQRDLKTHFDYNVFSEETTLILPIEKRQLKIVGMGQSNVWYGNSEMNEIVLNYINNFDSDVSIEINDITKNLESLEGYEKKVVTKARINQSKFRTMLLNKYKHCCLCGISKEELLVASHIKPWSKSDKNEKVNQYNGLLFCAMHDRLFDLGFISFQDDGTILICKELSSSDIIFSNINNKRGIEITDDNIPFIKYHRENIFRK